MQIAAQSLQFYLLVAKGCTTNNNGWPYLYAGDAPPLLTSARSEEG
jgi:hypothetical protein